MTSIKKRTSIFDSVVSIVEKISVDSNSPESQEITKNLINNNDAIIKDLISKDKNSKEGKAKVINQIFSISKLNLNFSEDQVNKSVQNLNSLVSSDSKQLSDNKVVSSSIDKFTNKMNNGTNHANFAFSVDDVMKKVEVNMGSGLVLNEKVVLSEENFNVKVEKTNQETVRKNKIQFSMNLSKDDAIGVEERFLANQNIFPIDNTNKTKSDEIEAFSKDAFSTNLKVNDTAISNINMTVVLNTPPLSKMISEGKSITDTFCGIFNDKKEPIKNNACMVWFDYEFNSAECDCITSGMSIILKNIKNSIVSQDYQFPKFNFSICNFFILVNSYTLIIVGILMLLYFFSIFYFIKLDNDQLTYATVIANPKIDIIQSEIAYFCIQFNYGMNNTKFGQVHEHNPENLKLMRSLNLNLFGTENYQHNKFKYSFFSFYTAAIKV